MHEQFQLRRMTPADVEAVVRLQIALIDSIRDQTGDDYFNYDSIPGEGLAEQLQRFLANGSAVIYVVQDQNRVIGFAAGEIRDCFLPFSKTKRIGYIAGAYVDPVYRHKGVLKKLAGRLEDFFHEHEISYVELHVIAGNLTAKKAWEALGYRTFREQMRKRI